MFVRPNISITNGVIARMDEPCCFDSSGYFADVFMVTIPELVCRMIHPFHSYAKFTKISRYAASLSFVDHEGNSVAHLKCESKSRKTILNRSLYDDMSFSCSLGLKNLSREHRDSSLKLSSSFPETIFLNPQIGPIDLSASLKQSTLLFPKVNYHNFFRDMENIFAFNFFNEYKKLESNAARLVMILDALATLQKYCAESFPNSELHQFSFEILKGIFLEAHSDNGSSTKYCKCSNEDLSHTYYCSPSLFPFLTHNTATRTFDGIKTTHVGSGFANYVFSLFTTILFVKQHVVPLFSLLDAEIEKSAKKVESIAQIANFVAQERRSLKIFS